MRHRSLAFLLTITALVGPLPPPATAQRAEQPGPSGAPGPMDELVLTRAALPEDITTGRLGAVVTAVGGWIAAGSTGPWERPRTLVLASADGLAWDRVTLDGDAANGDVTDLVGFAGGVAGIGRTRSGTAARVWMSADGTTWEAITADAFEGTAGLAIVAHGDGLVALGCALDRDGGCGSPVAWSSPDGRTWERATLDVDGTWRLHDVASVDGRLVLVGTTSAEGDGAAAVAWSDDGTRWEVLEPVPGATLQGVTVAADGVLLAAGWRTGPDGVSGLLLRSDDRGGSWTDAGVAAGAGTLFTKAVPEGAATIIIGGEGPAFSEPAPTAWSLDAIGGLTRAIADHGTTMGTGILDDIAVAADGTGGVAAGIEQGPEGDQPSLWRLEPGPTNPAVSPAPSASPAPTPAPTPRRTARPRPTPTPAPIATQAERYLLRGLPARIRRTCEPRRHDLPDGTIAAIDCRPAIKGVTLSTFYLMTTADANATLRKRRRTYLRHPGPEPLCILGHAGDMGEAGWAGSGICYLDERGRPNLRIVEDIAASCHPKALTLDGRTIRKPTVYTGVLGTGTVRHLFDAWTDHLTWWAYPDGLRGYQGGDSTGGITCADIAPERVP